jgi:hypothetical protein
MNCGRPLSVPRDGIEATDWPASETCAPGASFSIAESETTQIGTTDGEEVMNRFENRTVIVTGSARGMGASHARGFVAEGANVVIADILEQEGQTLAKELGGHGIFSRQVLETNLPGSYLGIRAVASHVHLCTLHCVMPGMVVISADVGPLFDVKFHHEEIPLQRWISLRVSKPA